MSQYLPLKEVSPVESLEAFLCLYSANARSYFVLVFIVVYFSGCLCMCLMMKGYSINLKVVTILMLSCLFPTPRISVILTIVAG